MQLSKDKMQHDTAKLEQVSASAQDPVPVRFAKNDPQDPAEGWSRWKRYRALALAMYVTYCSAFNASANGAASGGFREDHPGVTTNVFQASSFTYLAMLGIGPLVLAPVSETFGRRPQIVICTFIIMVLFLGQALAPNVYSVIFCRLIQGVAASVEGPVAAGVVADLWPKRVRGPAMGIFVLCVFTANATGPLSMNWCAQTLNWHWVYWIQMCTNALCFFLCLFFFPEPRADVILGKRCKQLEKETGRPHYVDGAERFEGWWQALKLSSTRPLLYLFTEPIVMALALWVGFAWGMVFLLIGAISHIFRETYGFSQGQAGSVANVDLLRARAWWSISGLHR
ncbi:major facilitator superfamily domain-containing protein, partial [Rhodotorula diobovata]